MSGGKEDNEHVVSEEEAMRMPPFPPNATYPDTTDPPHPHKAAEAMINVAAKHTLPERDRDASVEKADDEGQKQGKPSVTKEGTKQGEGGKEKDEREEKPLVGGTPLDEMTPVAEKVEGGQGFPFKPPLSTKSSSVKTPAAIPEIVEPAPGESQQTSAQAGRRGDAATQMSAAMSSTARPGFGVGHELGSVRMGASALFSALNALPWDGDEDAEGDTPSSSDTEDEDEPPRKSDKAMGKSVQQGRPSRPRASRMHSSLHTIRPMAPIAALDEEGDGIKIAHDPIDTHPPHHSQHLHFPFRENTIARKARSPGPNELEYQFGSRPPAIGSVADALIKEERRASDASSVNSLDSESAKLLNARIAAEQERAAGEEGEEILKTVDEEEKTELEPILTQSDAGQSEINTEAALREETGKDEVVEERMDRNPAERHRLRKEKLSERLMEVFGLAEREEVLEEMRCWLLRSVMLKGYMYLTPKHICFFARMPDKENLVVKTGPLSKKASRTKLNSKYWVILKNDVLSWYESTSDPYFPKGNVSLQYASSCDPIDETRFKVRTSERNYTFSADTEASRDEWVKAIQKVMFKVQHEGESVKLIIPLEVVLEVEKSPTLEFAETIELRCVDAEDHMSVDSYFFASFQDNDHAMSAIQALLAQRPPMELPRVNSSRSEKSTGSGIARRKRQSGEHPSIVAAATGGLKKVGDLLKPLVPSKSRDKSTDEFQSDDEKDKSSSKGLGIFKSKTSKASDDSLATLQEGESSEGYPPRQSGRPPLGMSPGKDNKWSTPSWIAKPATKIFGGTSSPSKSSSTINLPKELKEPSEPPPKEYWSEENARHRPRHRRGKSHSVTEVVEPTVPSDDESEDERSPRKRRSLGRPRLSFSSVSGSDDEHYGPNQSSFSMLERSETAEEQDEETARKFRSVFSLGDKEELIDHFPGYLYRVLPVSGRFFVSTNYFCFRSSQLLYKTKMIIPIRDLYGLKAQKAFRFGHSGLIVVIKGHEELFLEFSSPRRRAACIALLEARMEEVRVRSEKGEVDLAELETRIMEDLDENSPVDARAPPVSPSPMFGSTISTFLDFKPDKTMKITCLTIGSRGDVQPYIALCKGLQAEGHETKIATHGEYKGWVEGHGIEFASVGGDPAELMQMCVDNGMFTVSFLKEGLQKFRGWLDDLLTSSWEACQGSDLLIESPSAMGGIHIAEALRIPYYRAFTMPWTRTRAYPHAFAVPEHKRGGSYNYMTYTMFDQVFWRAIAGQVNRWRKNTLHIDSTTFDKMEQHKIPFLYNFSPNVVPPPLDWTEWIHVTGYWFLENAEESAEKSSSYKPPDGLLEFIDKAKKAGKKVVYIGFGSIVVSDPQEMTRCVVDAVVESGVCAILSKGWSDRGSKSKEEKGDKGGADGIEYPEEIFAIDSIDHTWLFPRIDAACHHGGAGTTGASLRAGIPTIIKPFFGDQAFWSERVESLNVGSAVRKLTSESLAEALKKATSDDKQIAKAKVVGQMIRKENGVAKAIEAIYRDLEYAKSLIKPPPEQPTDEEGNGERRSKRTSLLDPILHAPGSALSLVRSGTGSGNRSRSGSHSRGTSGFMKGTKTPPVKSASESVLTSTDGSCHEHHSDESWDVLSNDGTHESGVGSPDPARSRSRA